MDDRSGCSAQPPHHVNPAVSVIPAQDFTQRADTTCLTNVFVPQHRSQALHDVLNNPPSANTLAQVSSLPLAQLACALVAGGVLGQARAALSHSDSLRYITSSHHTGQAIAHAQIQEAVRIRRDAETTACALISGRDQTWADWRDNLTTIMDLGRRLRETSSGALAMKGSPLAVKRI